MMSLLYAPPSSGKTLVALAAFPDAVVLTPKREAVVGPAKLYGLDIPDDRVIVVRSMKDLKKAMRETKDLGVPTIIDDLTDILESEVTDISKTYTETFDIYGELKTRVIPFFQAVAKNAAHPVVITCWEREARIEKDLEGTKHIVEGGPALPGRSARDIIPGLCTHVLRVEGEEPATSSWPFVLRCRSTTLWRAKCRTPADVPEVLPLALSELYRTAGYDCAPMFDEQAECREQAKALLAKDDRAGLARLFAEHKSQGTNLHCVAYAVKEAQVSLALEAHTANLDNSLVDSFF
jgi:hypothetical protein